VIFIGLQAGFVDSTILIVFSLVCLYQTTIQSR